jgi:murein DD-endopeptidase MepM/ murein hydrolase activator NlpD
MDASARNDLPASARRQLAWALADVYEYRVDMSRDLQNGDAFEVVAERMVAPTGTTRIGRVLAATFKLSGSRIDVVRFSGDSANSNYFDQNGKSMRTEFLSAPLDFSRISSVFGGREHPILGGWRQHKGTDYAADAGTPVRAIGNGVVVREGWGSGYGNLLEIRHANGFVTRYGHLSRFASGVHGGSHVSIGETVAYVGSTGLATGPHLHFEVLVEGQQRDPRTALKSVGGEPVPSAERAAFEEARDRMLAFLDSPVAGVTKLAVR